MWSESEGGWYIERLTKRELIELKNGEKIVGCNSKDEDCNDYCMHGYCRWNDKALKKLKEYEDLEEQLEKVYGEHDGLLETAVKSLVKYNGEKPRKARLLTDEDADRWEEYKKLEEQGLLLRLSCKVGDTIYRINQYAKEPIISMKVLQVRFSELCIGNSFLRIDAMNDEDMGEFCYFKNDIGKTVFLTKEAAEAALKEMEK